MRFTPFGLEMWQSEHEQDVEYELADSGVQPVTLRELVNMGLEIEQLLDLPLRYPEVNGTRRLREQIAGLHPGASPDQVLVTVGAAEANGLLVQALTQPGDRVVVTSPNYPQLEGLALNHGCRVTQLRLQPDQKWRPDLEGLAAELRGDPPRLIALCNPNNPCGSVLDDADRAALIELAASSEAWLLVDEVYLGTELAGQPETRTFFGDYDRAIAVGGLSKAYGLSGLRLGWIVAPPEVIDAAWRRHEYATISAAAPSMALAEFALSPQVRPRLLGRNRDLITSGHATIADWVRSQAPALSLVAPRATPVDFPRVHTGEDSLSLGRRLREHAGVLIAPGTFFGFDDHVRITCALDRDLLEAALGRIGAVLSQSGKLPA